MEWLHKIFLHWLFMPPKMYWYCVKFEYQKNGVLIFSYSYIMGFILRNDVLQFEKIRKNMPPLHRFTKKELCNGTIHPVEISYLGRMRDKFDINVLTPYLFNPNNQQK